MSMREEFEAWLLEVHGLTYEWSEERNCFKDYPAHLAYKAWRASRAALVVELPDLANPTRWESSDNAWNNAIKACKNAIEAAGLQVKP